MKFAKPLIALFFLVFSTASFALFETGKAIPTYGPAKTPELQKLLDIAKKGQWAEGMAEVVNRNFRLKEDLKVGIGSCGQVNAFYDSRNKMITMCLEFIDLIKTQAYTDSALASSHGSEGKLKFIFGATWSVFFHELGHALLAINKIPHTGREEDVVDQFAFYFGVKVAEAKGFAVVVPAIWFWKSMGEKRNLQEMTSDQVKLRMADEHSMDQQRMYNIACWAVGSRLSSASEAVRMADLPARRMERCAKEAFDLKNGIENQFGKFLKLQKR